MKRLLNSKVIMSLLVVAMILILGASITYAWFQREVITDPIMVSTGDIKFKFSVYEYDQSNGILTKISSDSTDSEEAESNTLLSTETSFGESPRGNLEQDLPAYSVGSFNDSVPKTLYLLIERLNNSIDFDYTLSFNLKGFHLNPSDISINDLVFTGGFSFGCSPISPSSLGDGSSVNPSLELSNGGTLSTLEKILYEYCESNSEEYLHDDDSLSELYKFIPQDNLHEDNYFDIYRFDIHLNSEANVQDYLNRSFTINAKVFATQKNALTNELREGAHYYINTNSELEQILQTYKPGDNIHITNNIVYNKDLVFNRPVKLFVNGKKLHVFGNLMFSYGMRDEDGSALDTSGNGQVVVSAIGNTGGYFKINTPNSKFELAGSNNTELGKGDVYIQKDFFVNCSYDQGFFVSDSRVYTTGVDGNVLNTENSFKTIILQDNTTLDVSSTSIVGNVITDADVAVRKIAINNRGVIRYIELSAMYVYPENEDNDENNDMNQIYIYNNGEVTTTPIILPIWSDELNTIIIQGYTGSELTVTGSDPQNEHQFTNVDIDKENPRTLVEEIDDDPTRLLVHYTDINNSLGQITVHTLESILEDFYSRKSEEFPTDTRYSKTQTKELVVKTYGSKCLQPADYAYLLQMINVVDMDLSASNTYISNVTINNVVKQCATVPNKAFCYEANNPGKLTNLKLPNNTQYIGSVLTKNCNVDEIYLPPNVIAMNKTPQEHSTSHISFVHISSPNKLESYFPDASYPQDVTYYGQSYFFVKEELLPLYRKPFLKNPGENLNMPIKAGRFLPESHFDSKKEYLIRKVNNFDYEIVKYFGIRDEATKTWIHNEPAVIGDPSIEECLICEPGTNYPINVVSIHDFAYYTIYNNDLNPQDLTIHENVKYIGQYAFCLSKVKDVYINGVESIGHAAFGFSSITNLEAVSLKNVETYCFTHCEQLNNVNLCMDPGGSLKQQAFFNCLKMTFVSSGARNIGTSCFNHCVKLRYALLPNSNVIGDYSFNDCPQLTLVYFGKVSKISTSSLSSNVTAVFNDKDPIEQNSYTIKKQSFYSILNDECYNENLSGVSDVFFNISKNYNNKNYSAEDLYFDNGTRLLDSRNADEINASKYFMIVDKDLSKSIIVTSLARTIEPINNQITLIDKIELEDGNYPVEEIGYNAFNYVSLNCNQLILPPQLKYIGSYAFYNRNNNKTFSSVISVNELNDLENLEMIDSYGFYSVPLYSLVAPNLHTIGNYALYKTLFDNINYPNLTTISDYGFNSCTNLVTACLSMDNAGTIGQYAFKGCSSLRYLESGANEVKHQAFSGLSLEFLKMPHLKKIATGGVENNKSLRYFITGKLTDARTNFISGHNYPTIIINDEDTDDTILTVANSSIHVIRNNDYSYPNGRSTNLLDFGIDDLYFDNDLKLKNVNATNYTQVSDWLFVLDTSEGNGCSMLCSYTHKMFDHPDEDFVISNGVTFDGNFYPVKKIMAYTFITTTIRCNSVVLPSTLEEVGEYAFYEDASYGQKEFFSVTNGVNVNVIQQNAFWSSNLVFAYFPSVSYIGSGAFWHCDYLKYLIVGRLTHVMSEAVSYNPSSLVVFANSNDPDLYIEENGLVGNLTNNPRYIIDSNIAELYGSHSKTNRTMNTGDYSLDTYYLSNGVKLSDVHSPSDLENADALVAIDFSSEEPKAKLITYFALTLSDSVQIDLIEQVEIEHLENVITVDVDETISPAFRYTTIITPLLNIPDSYFKLGSYAFYGKHEGLEHVVMNNVKYIGDYCFYNNSETFFNNPNAYHAFINLEEVGKYAFYGCKNLRGAIALSDNVTKVETYAFSGCTSLFEVSAKNVIEISDFAFSNSSNICLIDMPKAYIIGVRPFALSKGSPIYNLGSCSRSGDAACFTGSFTGGPGAVIFNCVTTPVITQYIYSNSNNPDPYALYICDGAYRSTYNGRVTSSKLVGLPTGMSTYNFIFHNLDQNSHEREYILCETDAGLHLVYCRKTSLTNEELQSDIINIQERHGKNVISIGERCFAYTQFTGDLFLPDNVVDVNNSAFSLFSPTATFRNSIDTLYLNNVVSIGNEAFNNSDILEIEIGDSVRTIGNKAFYNNNTLESVFIRRESHSIETPYLDVLPSTNNFSASAYLYVYHTAYDEFYDDHQFGLIPLSNIVFLDYEHVANGFTFYYITTDINEDLENECEITHIRANEDNVELIIPSVILSLYVTSINEDAFKHLEITSTNISSITLPYYLEEFNYNPEKFLTTITEFKISEGDASGYPNFAVNDGVLYNADYTTLIAFPIAKLGNGTINEPNDLYTIPEGIFIQTIELNAFKCCLYVKHVSLIHLYNA